MTYNTQKARGLEIGWKLTANSGYGYKVPVVHGVLPHVSVDDLKEMFADGTPTRFARPCPVVPRHGFVESRIVRTIEELRAVLEETIKEDDKGEVILMDRLTGKYSAIMTAAGVTWGLGNDGVTSGKGEQKIIPTPPGKFDALLLPALGRDAAANEGVYCELVEHNGNVCVVQMRLGPKQPDNRRKRVLAASKVVVSAIIKPDSDDLIKWDKRLRMLTRDRAAGRMLAWLPGQSLASHFAVQAISQGYNVSVENECPVEPGQVLVDDVSENMTLLPEDYKEMAKMFRVEKSTLFWDFPRDVLLSVATLHSIPFWGNERHLLALRVRGAMIAARFGLAACVGEARHKSVEKHPQIPVQVPWAKLCGPQYKGDNRPSRSFVFLQVFQTQWKDCLKLAAAAADDMVLADHPRVMDYLAAGGKLGDGVHSASVRGQLWEYAALRVHDLIAGINRFVRDPKEDNWRIILGHYNEIINASHNGGYLLNKWSSPGLIDNAATSPALVFGYRSVMRLVFDLPAEKPFVCWLPKDMMPAEKKDDYVVSVDNGLWVQKDLYVAAQKESIINGEHFAIWSINLMRLGKLAMLMKMPVYVHGAYMSMMPDMAMANDIYPDSAVHGIYDMPDEYSFEDMSYEGDSEH